MNTQGTILRQVAPGAGKKRKVERIYRQRTETSDVIQDGIKVCTTDEEAGRFTDEIEFDSTGIRLARKINPTALADLCESNEFYVQEEIMDMMSAMLRSLNENLIALALAEVGKYGAGQTDLIGDVLQLVTRDGDGKIDEDFITELQFATLNANYNFSPFILGWNEWFKVFKKLEVGCCNNFGLDIGQMFQQFDHVFIPDRNVPGTFGTNGALIWEPGSLQCIYWNEFDGPVGINRLTDDSEQQTILKDPWVGFPFDYWVTWNCNDFVIGLKVLYKLVGLPDDMFHAGDTFDGVKWINQAVIANP